MTDPITDPDLVEHFDDFTLVRAYQRTDREPGNPEAEALLAEIVRRKLDI